MNLRIKDKLAKNILKKYQDNGRSFENLKLTRPERELERRVNEKFGKMLMERKTVKGVVEETWEERINRIDNYKFANPTPIRVHKSPTVWERLKDTIGGWFK